jgi:hypothetical protein
MGNSDKTKASYLTKGILQMGPALTKHVRNSDQTKSVRTWEFLAI